MAFSKEWDLTYQTGVHNSVWPWADVVSLTNRYFKGDKSGLKILELGSGAGANIPFFVQCGAKYCGIEGSQTEVRKLKERFASEDVTVKCADFTKEIPFDDKFDLIIDRSSVTHNSSADIRNVIRLVSEKMQMGGYYFGIDWFSINYGYYNTDDDEYEEVDFYTRVFSTGIFKGLGTVHFSDSDHIRELFSDMRIVEIYEKIDKWELPDNKICAHWNFIVKK